MAGRRAAAHRRHPLRWTGARHAPDRGASEDTGASRAMGGASRADALHDRSRRVAAAGPGAAAGAGRAHRGRLRPRLTRRWRRAPAGPGSTCASTLRAQPGHRRLAAGAGVAPAAARAPRLFVLVDVSRSMEDPRRSSSCASRAPLCRCAAGARVFVFHTRLAEVTPLLQRDSAAVQEKVNAVTAGFGGGTRIAASLAFPPRARPRPARRARACGSCRTVSTPTLPEACSPPRCRLRGHGARITWFHPGAPAPALGRDAAAACR
jgi:uncharacterized protein